MTPTISEHQASYLGDFARHDSAIAKSGPRWLQEMRQEAIERFADLGFPTTHDEDWKFTNIAPLKRVAFELAGLGDEALAAEFLEDLPSVGMRLVFLNGRFVPGLSDICEFAGNLKEAQHDLLKQHLARYADHRKHAFMALNTAFLSDGGFVHIGKGKITEPIHLIHISTPGPTPAVSHPRSLIVIGEAAHASIVETFVGAETYLTNAVTEIVQGAGSVVDHVKLQRESDTAFHLATMQIQQGRDSVFTSRSFAFGGALARTEINAVLEQGSECTLNGLYVVDGKRHIDTRTAIDHAKPNAASHELYKGILSGNSSAVFNGKIIVRKDAQKTDAKQTNKNLVLSENASINTKPQLEIFADDVRCTHGATVGQLDEEAIFYLRSRGIAKESARSLLTLAFAREIVDSVKSEPLRESLNESLTSLLEGV